ncbi:MAG: NUDIX domain-containing protein [Verrucomicrobiota bacterium]|nr:NUDIX domain-containing protein [Verrucomicrobiota bacterium]
MQQDIYPENPDATQEELFDVVDVNDCILRQEKRSIVHKERLLHRAIHVFIFNGSGQLYLQRRSMGKDTAPGKWVSSCSGHVDSGEDYDISARRELGEELGHYETNKLKRIFKEQPCIQTGYEFVWVYTCLACGPFKLNPLEVSDGQWVDLDHLDRWLKERPKDFAQSFIYLWAKYRTL